VKLAAIVFDFDGIIVDSEPLHYRAYQQVLAPEGLGFPWEEYRDGYMGFDDRDALRERFRRAGRPLGEELMVDLIARKARAFKELVEADHAVPYPGVLELLRSTHGRVPLAVCSGALPGDIRPIFRKLGIGHVFDLVVTAEDVPVSKPDPECYALTLEGLRRARPESDLQAGRIVAIEDTPAGIAAAKGAGLRVLAVTNSYPREALTGADWVEASLEGVTVDGLERRLSEEPPP
jgi:HAD superfamily hydrolase (TIGR01509 family)